MTSMSRPTSGPEAYAAFGRGQRQPSNAPEDCTAKIMRFLIKVYASSEAFVHHFIALGDIMADWRGFRPG